MLRSSLKIRLPRCAFKTVVCFKSSYNENDTVSTREMTFSCYVRAFEHPHLYHAPPDPNQRPIKLFTWKLRKLYDFLPQQLFGILGCFLILFFIFILFFMSTEHEFLISAFKTANFRIKIASTDIEWGLGLTKNFIVAPSVFTGTKKKRRKKFLRYAHK